MTRLPRVTDAQRRARLMRRHCLTPATRAASVTEAADRLIGFHATTASTVHLSAWARIDDFDSATLESALYSERSLVKQLCMRRTLFVMTRPVLAEAIGAVGPRVTASERTNMLRDLRRSDDVDDPDAWIDTAVDAVRGELAGGAALTSTQLRQRLSSLELTVTVGAGRTWGGRIPMGPRILSMMSAAGEIVRGPNAGQWYTSRPAWVSMREWLGEEVPAVSVADGHRALIRRWLAAFGPGTETDLVWWLGSTKTAVRAALADLDVVEVELDSGDTGYLLAEDLDDDDLGAAPDADLGALLLPGLDPTTMGHKQRDFYLGAHGSHVFDSVGNGGQTAWWGGRIVGGWQQEDDGAITVHPMEPLPRAATRALAARAVELAGFFGHARPKPGFPAPFMSR